MTASDDLGLFYDFFLAFNKLKDGIFGNILAENWKELCLVFKTSLLLLNSTVQVPVTPKLHVMAVHVQEWVETHGRAMGEDSEQSVEASHGRFLPGQR